MKVDTLVKNGLVVSPFASVQQLDIAITDGKISALLQHSSDVDAFEVIDIEGKYLLPGIIDPHVHYGLGSADDYNSETAAAAIGGVTTVGNFLMNPEPYEDHFDAERQKGEDSSHVDFFFHFIKITPLLVEKERYLILPILCKYITYFHNIHEDIIEVTLFTHELQQIL